MDKFSSVHFMAGSYRNRSVRKSIKRKNGTISGFSGQEDYPEFINLQGTAVRTVQDRFNNKPAYLGYCRYDQGEERSKRFKALYSGNVTNQFRSIYDALFLSCCFLACLPFDMLKYDPARYCSGFKVKLRFIPSALKEYTF